MTACLWLTFCALVLYLSVRWKVRAYCQQRRDTAAAQRQLTDPRTAAAQRRLGLLLRRDKQC